MADRQPPDVRIVFKLYATLTDYLPEKGRDMRHELDLDVPQGTTVTSMVERFKLPPRLVHLVLINGVYVPPAERPNRELQAGDHLAIWPPIAGG